MNHGFQYNFTNIYEQLFCTKMFLSAFLYLQFGFVNFFRTNTTTKAACRKLVKLTSRSMGNLPVMSPEPGSASIFGPQFSNYFISFNLNTNISVKRIYLFNYAFFNDELRLNNYLLNDKITQQILGE